MGTTTARIEEQDYETVREVSEQANVSVPEVLSEVLDRVDLDEILDETQTGYVGRCPECGAGIPHDNATSYLLSNRVKAQCPEAERDDDVHVEERTGEYDVTDLESYD